MASRYARRTTSGTSSRRLVSAPPSRSPWRVRARGATCASRWRRTRRMDMQGVKDSSALYEVERRARHAERPGFRINELQISPKQQVPWHFHTNIQDTFYVLEGELRLFLREPKEDVRLRPGEAEPLLDRPLSGTRGRTRARPRPARRAPRARRSVRPTSSPSSAGGPCIRATPTRAAGAGSPSGRRRRPPAPSRVAWP